MVNPRCFLSCAAGLAGARACKRTRVRCGAFNPRCFLGNVGSLAAVRACKRARVRLGSSSTSAPVGTLGLTENLALTFLATGSATLDLFFDSVPGIELQKLERLLVEAWEEDAETTLRIIFQLGDPRQGKGDLVTAYRALLWLYHQHYDTFMLNVEQLPRFLFYRALLDMLCYASGPGVLEADLAAAHEHKKRKEAIRSSKRERRIQRMHAHKQLVEEFLNTLPCEERASARVTPGKMPVWATESVREAFVNWVQARQVPAKEEAALLRRAARSAAREAAERKLQEDSRYHRLYEVVADRFALELAQEAASVEAGESIGGLAAKWAPTPALRHDKRTRIVDGIVERLFPPEQYRLPEGTYENYLSFMRDKYRKLLSTLRAAAEVPEHFVGGGNWNSVNYRRMASRCRLVHGHVFRKHDQERYDAYLEAVRQGKEKGLAAGAVLPHELTRKAVTGDGDTVTLEASLQWQSLVRDTKASGAMPSALAVCDVSGSMWGTPMEVAIALSLLLTDIAEEPWKGSICTFSQEPQFVRVPPPDDHNLGDRCETVQGMDWGMNTNLQKVFDKMLEVARFHALPEERMAKVLFIFSDMEFDSATGGLGWKTDLEHIREKYKAAGYEVPLIVFWNLRASRSHPAEFDEEGVAMLSGFSAGMLKSFLAFKLEDLSPKAQMVVALEPYADLRVAESDVLQTAPSHE